jgi:hypothetical protein
VLGGGARQLLLRSAAVAARGAIDCLPASATVSPASPKSKSPPRIGERYVSVYWNLIPTFWMSDGLFLCFPGDCPSYVASMIGSVLLSLYLPIQSLVVFVCENAAWIRNNACFMFQSSFVLVRIYFQMWFIRCPFQFSGFGTDGTHITCLANDSCKLSWYWVMHLQGTKIIGASKPCLTPRHCTPPAQRPDINGNNF